MSQDASLAIPAAGSGIMIGRQGDAAVLRSRATVVREDSGRVATTLADLTDEQLVARVRLGQPEAFEILVTRYQDRLYTIIHGFVRDADDAMDLVQDSFIKAFQGLHGFRGGSSFYTWLYRIAVNNCKDFLRKRASRSSVSLDDEHLQDVGFEPVAVDADSDPVGAAETRELRAMVRDAVEMLPDKLRMAVVLHDIQGLSQQDVASILNCPLGTAKSHVFRGRARLRKLLGRYVEDGG